MANDSNTHHRRRSIRLQGYDYTQAGAYFVTLCAYNRQCLFGEIVDVWVVMPNHFHGIVMMEVVGVGAQGLRPSDMERIRAHSRAPLLPNPNNRIRQRLPQSLGALIAGFKSAATKQINQWRQSPGAPVWQRNYWEHVVRNEMDLQEIRQYIVNNPMSWTLDTLYVKEEHGRALPCGRFLP